MSRAPESAAVVDTGATPSTAKAGYVYERRRPELGTLHQVVRDNLQTLHAAVKEGSASPLPDVVRREFEPFLDCGLLCRGFALFECEDCAQRRLVALSGQGRAWCCACCGRRMAQTAAN
ncbi:transposase zinc-binding domain-containing protein [Myxococcota bacterium]